jgi:hypothetical protein
MTSEVHKATFNGQEVEVPSCHATRVMPMPPGKDLNLNEMRWLIHSMEKEIDEKAKPETKRTKSRASDSQSRLKETVSQLKALMPAGSELEAQTFESLSQKHSTS